MRFEITATRRVSGTCLVAALMLSACLGAPPTTPPDVVPEPARSARPVRIDAATPFPILTHGPLRPSTPPPSASPAGVGATAGLPSAAPVASPLETPTPDLAELLMATALASASPLPAADAAAVAEALAEEEVEILLPADLIHDGGTALYRLSASSDASPAPDTAGAPTGAPTDTPRADDAATEIEDATAEPGATDARPAPGGGDGRGGGVKPALDAEPPTGWARQQVAVGEREAATARGKRVDEAGAAVGFLSRGTFAYKPAEGGETVRKPFVEMFRRQVGLKKGKVAWRPNALGPMRIETQGGESGLAIARLKLTSPDDASIGFEIGETDVLTPLADLPHASAGGKLRLEAEVRDRRAGARFVYGRLVGAGAGQRVLLRDDGKAPDREAGDGIYAWELKAPHAAGYHHLVIDVLDARCFAPKGRVRSLAVGFTFEVKP